jgi:hypothetical protein
MNKLIKVVLFLPVVPLICGLAATAMFIMQGGFGGGHGPYDYLIGILGLPSILLMEMLPLPDPILEYDILLVVWIPVFVNTLLFSLVSWALLKLFSRVTKGF